MVTILAMCSARNAVLVSMDWDMGFVIKRAVRLIFVSGHPYAFCEI